MSNSEHIHTVRSAAGRKGSAAMIKKYGPCHLRIVGLLGGRPARPSYSEITANNEAAMKRIKEEAVPTGNLKQLKRLLREKYRLEEGQGLIILVPSREG